MHEAKGDEAIGVGLSRRDFLRASGIGMATGLAGRRVPITAGSERSVILLLLVGGPGQHETFDPKPEAPAEIRGPFGSIATRIPGVRVSEHLPRLADRMDRVALIRSVHHDGAPIHEVGQQLLQTGRVASPGGESPHLGSVVARLDRDRCRRPARPPILLPGPIASTGVEISHGQSSGWLGADLDPVATDPWSRSDESGRDREAYGPTDFGRSCWQARRSVEAGARVVTVNMYETVFGRVSWDCHGASPFSTFGDYAREVLPTFDRAFSALIDDLGRSGRLGSTMVVAAGEFGRTPMTNASGGRDHWPGVWSVAIAGGGVRGGRIVGASDAIGSEPVDRPVTLPELLATMYHGLGIDHRTCLATGEGGSMPLVEQAEPIRELFTG